MRNYLSVLVLTAAALCRSALADLVALKNGDRLTGSIVKSDGKNLIVKSEFAGTVNILIEARSRMMFC